jgi:hypothetical protein
MYKTNKSILPLFRNNFFILDLTNYFMNILLSFYLFIYSAFSNTVSSLVYVASKGVMIVGIMHFKLY